MFYAYFRRHPFMPLDSSCKIELSEILCREYDRRGRPWVGKTIEEIEAAVDLEMSRNIPFKIDMFEGRAYLTDGKTSVWLGEDNNNNWKLEHCPTTRAPYAHDGTLDSTRWCIHMIKPLKPPGAPAVPPPGSPLGLIRYGAALLPGMVPGQAAVVLPQGAAPLPLADRSGPPGMRAPAFPPGMGAPAFPPGMGAPAFPPGGAPPPHPGMPPGAGSIPPVGGTGAPAGGNALSGAGAASRRKQQPELPDSSSSEEEDTPEH
ncbi:unnamed protein product [Polarella glacialis]|uniref:Uncharacterized protein n=1 Tax=Polarella glacialis TaxID=89957 RepID=A0A813DGQ9_POLGL|nr:unnamed protein product [Polarella glacialis]